MKKTEPRSGGPKYETSLMDDLYQLNYVSGNAQRFKLLKFDVEIPLTEAVRLAKRYCDENSYRFIYLEHAITRISTVENEDET